MVRVETCKTILLIVLTKEYFIGFVDPSSTREVFTDFMDLLYFIFSVSFSFFVCRALLKTASGDVWPLDKYLLLAECEVRKESYGPSFFLPLNEDP